MTGTGGMRRYAQLARLSPKRAAELRDAGLVVPGSTLGRKGQRTLPERPTKRHPTPTGPTVEVMRLVISRAMRGGRMCCEVCGGPIDGGRGFDWSLHHRKGRMGERTDNSPANLLLVCGASNADGCHGEIHQRRSWSQPLGLWISRNAVDSDPALIPVCLERESRWQYLTTGGQYSDEPPGGVG